MKELNNYTLEHTYGGISAAFFATIIRGGGFIMDAGRALGSAIRRYFSHNMCGF